MLTLWQAQRTVVRFHLPFRLAGHTLTNAWLRYVKVQIAQNVVPYISSFDTFHGTSEVDE